MRRRILAASLGLLVLASCQKTESPNVLPTDGVMRFSTDVLETKAGATSENITAMGVYVDGVDAAYDYSNVSVTKDATSGWVTGEMMLWKNSTTAVTISAYSPYETVYGAGFTIQSDQSTDANVIASDFLYAQSSVTPSVAAADNALVKYNTSTNKVDVKLEHILSKLVINLTINDENDLSSGTPITGILIKGSLPSVDITIADGGLSTASGVAGDIKPFMNDDYTVNATTTQATQSCEAIIIPQVIAANGFSIVVTIGGKDYTWVSPEAVTFVTKQKHTLDLVVGKNEITQLGFTVTDWDTNTTDTNLGTE